MAFVSTGLPVLNGGGRRSTVCVRTPCMSIGKNGDVSMSRRSVLHVAFGGALGIGLLGLRQVDAEVSEESKQELDKLDYNDSLFDEGPYDSDVKVTAGKKVEQIPEYKDDVKEIKENSKKNFDSMVAEEKAELERVKKLSGRN